MAKKNLKYSAEKIDELLTKADEQMATKSDLTKKVDKVDGKGLSTNDYTTAEKAKLAGIQEGAQKNTVTSVRGALQLNPQVGNVVISAADIGLGDANARLTSLENNKLNKSEKGATNGVASLDENGRVPSSQLPSYVDDVIEVANYESLPTSGESGKIYITQSDNKTYRWSGNGYAEVSASLALGETEQSAYSGAKGKKNAEDIAKLAKDLDETHQLASNAESAISEVVELTIPAIESELENKLGKAEKAAESAKADNAKAIRTFSSYGSEAVTRDHKTGLIFESTVKPSNLPWGTAYANAIISFPRHIDANQLTQIGFSKAGIYHRSFDGIVPDITTPWSQIAFTDSTVANAEKLGNVAAADYMQKSGGTFTGNVTAPKFIGALQGNADSATKFATARKIWGQSFDGSGDINGNAKIAGQLSTDSYIVSTGAIIGGGDNVCQISNNAATVEMRVTAAGSARLMHWKDGAGKNIIGSDGSNTFLQTGNVGIGTTNPSEKLDVNGNAKAVKFIGALQGNADSATKLAAARTIWGQSFDGTGDVSGEMTISGDGRKVVNVKSKAASDYAGLIAYMSTSSPTSETGGVVFNGSSATYKYGGNALNVFNTRGDIHYEAATNYHHIFHNELKFAVVADQDLCAGVRTAFKTSIAQIGALIGNHFYLGKEASDKYIRFRKYTGISNASPSSITDLMTIDTSGNVKASGSVSAKGLQIDGDVVITGNVSIQGRLESAASYQSNPLSTISEGEVPSVEQQLRAQIATLEERIAALEQLIAQNNG